MHEYAITVTPKWTANFNTAEFTVYAANYREAIKRARKYVQAHYHFDRTDGALKYKAIRN